MGYVNQYVKYIVLNVNFIFFVLAMGLIGLSGFILTSDWGTLDPTFFLGWCIISILFGGIMMLVSFLGCLGVTYQSKERGCWTGRQILLVYQLILIGTLMAELYAVSYLANSLLILQHTNNSLAEGNSPEYGDFEIVMSSRFNEFYFSAVNTCSDSKYNWFWYWINSNCIEDIGQAKCERCDDFSITYCIADESTCYASNEESTGSDTCPYELCRSRIINTLLVNIGPLANFAYAFAAFQSLLLFMGCMLICYTEKESLESFLIRTGTVTLRNEQHTSNRRLSRVNRIQNNSHDNFQGTSTVDAEDKRIIRRPDQYCI